MHVDLAFRLQGADPIPADHRYALYAAVSHLIPEMHQENCLAIHPIGGRQVWDRRLMLMPWSTLTVRVPDSQIAALLKLAGKSLRLDDTALRVGVPEVHMLVPSTAVRREMQFIQALSRRRDRRHDQAATKDAKFVSSCMSLRERKTVICRISPLGVNELRRPKP